MQAAIHPKVMWLFAMVCAEGAKKKKKCRDPGVQFVWE